MGFKGSPHDTSTFATRVASPSQGSISSTPVPWLVYPGTFPTLSKPSLGSPPAFGKLTTHLGRTHHWIWNFRLIVNYRESK